jgi:hypothetical protein
MEKLPNELFVEVLKGLDFADVVNMPQVSRWMREQMEDQFTWWLAAQAVGQPLTPFRGSPAEMRFLQDSVDGVWVGF